MSVHSVHCSKQSSSGETVAAEQSEKVRNALLIQRFVHPIIVNSCKSILEVSYLVGVTCRHVKICVIQ